MLWAYSRSFVCWRCSVRRAAIDVSSRRIGPTSGPSGASHSLKGQKASPPASRGLATVRHDDGDGDSRQNADAFPWKEKPGKPAADQRPPIRDRLRQWEAENPGLAQALLLDVAQSGGLCNSYTRPQNVSIAQVDETGPLFEGDELSDLRSDCVELQPGDMVEIASDGLRRPVMAISLGRFHGYDHFYASSGKWFTGTGVKTLFVVHHFVEPSEVEPIVAALPKGEISLETLNALQDLDGGPSRELAAPILRKMLKFSQDAEAVYQANAGTLDASSSFIGDPVKHRYLTLHELANLLLPPSSKRDGKFSSEALYAVHRALMQDEVFFRPLKQTGHRKSYLFEVSPLSEVQIVQKVEAMVRDYLETPPKRRDSKQLGGAMAVSNFLRTARAAIDRSRETREYSQTGMIGPSDAQSPVTPSWTATDKNMLRFVELWAGYGKFPGHSRLQCFGSTIIRALDRYQDAKLLDSTTGWTFLQEVGWITPWDITARYKIRFPEVEIKRAGGFTRAVPEGSDRELENDILQQHRKTWHGVTAYCIDAETTMDIDDAVSLELTPDPSQSWIHVHVADPASQMLSGTPLAKYAELIPETIYLSGNFERMLPADFGREQFSLAPDRPCLTFSSLVDDSGSILDYKITPGYLKDVVYITADDVNVALGKTTEDPLHNDQELSIGEIQAHEAPARHMTRHHDLTQQHTDELRALAKLGRAIQSRRLDKGAMPFFKPRPQPELSFHHVGQHSSADGAMRFSGDPAIRIAYPPRSGTDLVENTMKLAGEVAARWCAQRGVPIPFRSQPGALRNAEQMRQYSRDVIYPKLKAGLSPSEEEWRHLRSLLGSDELSTKPGPHFTLGVDMYTKATSPLRRFGDLIVHWQIEAAIMQEQWKGSLVGNKDDSFLPFTRERLERVLPMLRVRERQVKSLANADGSDQLLLQALVRAWRFGGATLPETFTFTVSNIAGRQSLQGRLNWFERRADMRVEHLNGVVKLGQVKIGDSFEVKIQHVNVHANQILIEAVRKLDSAEQDEFAPGLGNAGDRATELKR